MGIFVGGGVLLLRRRPADRGPRTAVCNQQRRRCTVSFSSRTPSAQRRLSGFSVAVRAFKSPSPSPPSHETAQPTDSCCTTTRDHYDNNIILIIISDTPPGPRAREFTA
ncbi:unnamed protein product [Macrosiphum euphorbiae]|uniref:Uncharacterized protein n=1 Tax=Macrosiphum euphorbiae TaxID=13131 RepID=A0AAV0WFR0_9HEMI|nr:unnamed protein product [Macrosiphum euphorbiae]